MDDLKGLAEVIDRLVYEALGLVVPGATLVVAVMATLGSRSVGDAITLASAHPWFAAGASWIVGLILQGVSGPITDVADLVFTLPWRLIRRLVPQGPSAATHAPQADLRALAQEYWRQQLRLAPGVTLRPEDVRDLSFSVITTAQGRLSRFRALASGTRALAAVAALIVAYAIVSLIITRPVSTGWSVAGALALVSYYALTERSRMYNQLWDDIIPPQLLATVSGEAQER